MLLISNEEMLNSKYNALIPLQCDFCNKQYFKLQKFVKYCLKMAPNKKDFCSKKCAWQINVTSKQLECDQCKKIFIKRMGQIKKCKKHFCSRSCSATYTNSHKTTGTRVSKLEKWLQLKLIEKYPNLTFVFNEINAINAELDIYIPSLKLAFELNGIFHYEPIYGKDKLDKTQNNDKRKFQACLEQNIELCIIDVSKQQYFKEQSSYQYLDIITKIIDSKLQIIN